MKVICTAATWDSTTAELKRMGFVWVCGNPTAEYIKENHPTTKYFVIDCFYNHHLKRNEMQYETEAWYKKHNKI